MSKEGIRLTKIEIGTFIEGTIKADADLRIDGEVKGTLKTSQRIFIGTSGSFKGEATAESFDICGRFEGTIKAKGKLILRKTAHFIGDISVGNLEIEEGAHFQGHCDMGGAAETAEDQSKMKQLNPENEKQKNKAV